MRIVATRVYSRKVSKLLSEKERRVAEDEIAREPLRWPVIRGTGGVRKARAGRGSSGKSGGVRIIYYFWINNETLYLLTIYAKSERDDLTHADRQALRKIVEALQENCHG